MAPRKLRPENAVLSGVLPERLKPEIKGRLGAAREAIRAANGIEDSAGMSSATWRSVAVGHIRHALETLHKESGRLDMQARHVGDDSAGRAALLDEKRVLESAAARIGAIETRQIGRLLKDLKRA
ncbi:MAG: hypothetical protein KGI00_00590 [Candidatus Micrarchaeota archaeon]|nr:hypothetical protein [Candidatus Micrarchaeota archaeon]MDE1849210.1 hypothetical protein [Candidatus Micrarchaeota archaeon]